MINIKRILSSVLISFFIYINTPLLSEPASFFFIEKNYPVIGLPHNSQHTTAYNANPDITEKVYLEVRNILNVNYINNHVTIINVPTKENGTIGKIGGDDILGLYTNNIILFDGDPLTLRHELAHFFYEKMRTTDRSEMFAQITEKFYILVRVLIKGQIHA